MQVGTCIGMRGCVYVGVYTGNCKEKDIESLGHEGMTEEQGETLLPQTPLTKRIFKLGFT